MENHFQITKQTILEVRPLEKTDLLNQYPQSKDRQTPVLILDNGQFLVLHRWELIDGYTGQRLNGNHPLKKIRSTKKDHIDRLNLGGRPPEEVVPT